MNFIQRIIENKLDEAKESIFNRLNEIAATRLNEAKRYVAEDTYVFEEESNVL